MIREFKNAAYGTVRTALVDNEPCFCLKDICNMLEIKSVSHCRGKLNETGIKTVSVPNESGSKNMLFITSDNISGCLFQSKKAEAEVICDWLFRIVLPQLRKYSDYKVDDFQDVDVVVKFLDEYEDLKIRTNILETTIKINSPKLNSINRLLGTSNCYDLDIVHQVIKYKGINNAELLKILRANHILDESNIPYQEYCDKKYFRVVEAQAVCRGNVIVSKRTYVYQNGITFIERLIKEYQGEKRPRLKPILQ
jgi:anti-repressor protein